MVSDMAMAYATPSEAAMAMTMANKRPTVRVDMSAMDATRATAKLMKKFPDEASFPLPVMP